MAAWVVRTAAPVAVRMPIQPAEADSSAPTRKLTAVSSEFPGRKSQSTRNMTATKPASTVYSVRRNAIAPVRIRAAMRCIRSVPGDCRLMVRIRYRAKRADRTGAPQPRAKYSD